MRPILWMAVAISAVGLSSCQKSTVNGPASGTNSTSNISGIVVGLPPAYLWWSTLPILPFSDGEPGDIPGGDDYPMGFAINGKGYFLGSVLYDSHSSAETIHNMFEYDITTNTYTEKAPIPGYPPVEGVSFVIGNDAYVLSPESQFMYRYDQPTNTWTIAASLPVNPERFNATAFAVNGKGYVGLGDGEVNNVYTRFNDWWEYDPASNTWAKKKNFPGGARVTAAGFAVDSYGYVCSGDKRTGTVDSYPNDLWQYNPTTDAWVQKANMPGAGFGGVGLNGIVDAGGHYGFVVTGGPGRCLQYNPSTNTWGTLPDMPGGSRNNFAAFMINRSLVIGGGTGGTSIGGWGRMDVHSLNWTK
jgi:N-acetylneuraminic acid mutarotase